MGMPRIFRYARAGPSIEYRNDAPAALGTSLYDGYAQSQSIAWLVLGLEMRVSPGQWGGCMGSSELSTCDSVVGIAPRSIIGQP